jgi:hypothetical protein
VRFTIDNTVITTEKSRPYSLGGDDGVGKLRNFDTTTLSNGNHVLSILVTGDNTTAAKQVQFTVNNQTSAVPSNTIFATDNLNVRSTPGGAKIGIQPQGAPGVIVTTTTGTVTVDGHTWVYVDFASGVDGYVAQTFLSRTAGGTSVIQSTQIQIDAIMKQIMALQALLNALKTAQ